MKNGFEWVVAPDVIAKGLDDYGKKVYVALHAAAAYWGQHIQDKARNDASWMDRTANARSGLFFAVDGFGLNTITGEVTPGAKTDMSDVAVESGSAGTLIITLGHTVFYGKFLETSNGGKFAIVMSTIEKNLAGLDRMVRDVFKG